MKYLTTICSLLLIYSPLTVFAETEEEEMARMQKMLNNRVFGFDKKPEPAPAPTPAAKPVPVPVPTQQTAANEPDENSSTIPLSEFTNFKLAGLSLGKEEQAVLNALQNQGYNCNAPQLAKAYQLTGKRMCIYISGEDPKMAMIGFAGGRLRDLETHETYTTGFPEKFFKRAKDKFMKKYGSEVSCKAKGKGEICEVFGHGYRVLYRTEIGSRDKAKIIHRIAKM